MSRAEELARHLDGFQSRRLDKAAAELRRLSAVEAELEALKKAISEAEPVACQISSNGDTWAQFSMGREDEARQHGLLVRKLYTLKGIK